MISATMHEVRELHELNVELMDTLLIIGQRIIECADKHDIPIQNRDSLASLIGRAQRLLEEIGNPYRGQPIISDASYHQNNSDDSDDNLTEPLARVLLSYDKSEALR